jgi:hypothetical protein
VRDLGQLHLPALATFALRCWLRTRRRVGALPAPYELLCRRAEECAIAAAQGRLTTKENDNVYKNVYDARFREAKRAVYDASRCYRRVQQDINRRDWPKDPQESARLMLDIWRKAQPNFTAPRAGVVQGADLLHWIAITDLMVWQYAWNNLHFDDFTFGQAHYPALVAARELRALTEAIAPEEGELIQRDLDRLLEITPPLILESKEIPSGAGHMDPLEAGPLGPLWESAPPPLDGEGARAGDGAEPDASLVEPSDASRWRVWLGLAALVPAMMYGARFFLSSGARDVPRQPMERAGRAPGETDNEHEGVKRYWKETPGEKLVDLQIVAFSASFGSYLAIEDWNTGAPVLTVLSPRRETSRMIHVGVPSGVYRVWYATGESWLDENRLFGAATRVSDKHARHEFSVDRHRQVAITLLVPPRTLLPQWIDPIDR